MKRALFFSLLLWFSRGALMAQGTDASTVPVALGQSVVALTGPWKFHIGDDPNWADPNYDDSQWETVDLTPTRQTTVPGVPIPGFVTGWQARGHRGYSGYAWYRMRVHITGADDSLTLLGPEWFDSAFQVSANGRLVGSFGDFSGPVPELYEGNPSRFSLHPFEYGREPDGSTLIAFRFYMPAASLEHPVTGGMHGPPRIGLPTAATADFHMQWEREYRRLASAFAAALLFFIFAVLVTMIFAFSRTEKTLLWPLSACIFQFIQFALIISTNARWMSEVRLEALIGFANLVAGFLWLLTWWAYFGLQTKRWLFKTILGLAILNLAALEFFTIVLRIGRASPVLLVAQRISGLCTGSAVFLVMATIAWLGWKGAERRQWPLFLALFFQSFQVFEPWMALLHMRTAWQPFGVIIPIGLISNFSSLICFSVVLFGQFRASLKRQQAMEDDVKQAQEIQQILIPEQLPKLSGWNIESEYRPAREVGGDFFQIVLNKDDDSLLIVAGDVTGKGLQAGMLVAMLVGTIRTESAHTSDAARILGALNARLHGRAHAQATCLALHINADGAATLANAGHLPPYLNGEPLAMEGALPLGMIEAAEFSVMHFQLKHGDKLMLMSDGIAEATDANGKLFGFERIHELLRTNRSAIDVADAAQAFGQEDDISVIAIARTTTPEPAAV